MIDLDENWSTLQRDKVRLSIDLRLTLPRILCKTIFSNRLLTFTYLNSGSQLTLVPVTKVEDIDPYDWLAKIDSRGRVHIPARLVEAMRLTPDHLGKEFTLHFRKNSAGTVTRVSINFSEI